MIASEEEQATLTIAYEFMFAEYVKEKRRTKHRDPIRLQWLRVRLERYQVLLRKLSQAGMKFDFTEL